MTGGAGFIGSHLVERLLGEGHEVLVLDNYVTGKQKNLKAVLTHPRLKIRELDIAEFDLISPSFSRVDWVFHLAALADIVPSMERPLAYYRSNVAGTVAVVEAARQASVKRFIYVASSSCYGIPQQIPTPETADIRPQYPYALTKYLGEQIVFHWNLVYKLPAVSLRLFNVYGPRARTTGTYGAVFGVFLTQKLMAKPFTVVGDGNQTRDFTFVTDVVEALVRAAESGLSGEIFNIGSGQTYSVNHLVELLGGPVVHIPKRPGEPEQTFANIRKVRRMLGWNPKVGFQEGVRIMLDQIKDWKEAPLWDEKSIAEATRAWFAYLGQRPEKDESPSPEIR